MDTIRAAQHPQSSVAANRPFPSWIIMSRTIPDFAGRALWWMFDTILDWQERARQRHALMTLDDRMLKDIGVTRGQVTVETEKRFWQS
jgi:uncharacterized protein YjiS (DUF1127 family)